VGRLRLSLAGALCLLAALPATGFERSEEREPCAEQAPLRRAFFGDTHVHTTFSFDANALGTRNTPRDAYRFARGEPLGLQPYDAEDRALRSARLERPLDFAIVTDHAELLGETRICATPGLPGYDSIVCRVVRRWPLISYFLVNSRIFNVSDPQRFSFCGADGSACLEAAAGPWMEIQRAAEEAYDRSSACRFTSFVGYEWSGNPDSNMIHRNVIFRNAVVPELPTSYVDENRPEGLWRHLHEDCLDRGNGCDVLTIPHNSNLSGGWLFRVETPEGGPISRDEALARAALEPLVEVMQHKGDSECRLEADSEDELCGFEKIPFATMDQQPFPFLWKEPPRMAFVRAALGEGLAQEERLGVNPFKYGLIASTDTHIGTPGLVEERGYPGHGAGGDTTRVAVPRMPDSLAFNPGGLAVLWAEENSRDALFAAMRRREAYGTSGPRILVRFFGGWDFPDDLCERRDLVEEGYAHGVPMGGDLPERPARAKAPRFALSALRDPGTPANPGALLQRAQIVKVWLEAGAVREHVFEVAGDPESGAGVDPRTCQRTGPGFDALCGVWSDPSFEAGQRALYYARVVENPSCRWSTFVCNANGVDCDHPGGVPSELRACCDPGLHRTIQERAWTSPIWYTPASEAQKAGAQ
jgi:hypothetical protein